MFYRRLRKTRKVLTNVHLQLDNTTRENKNKFVMSLCARIVEIGVAKNILVGFCQVGYVQMFSLLISKP